MCRERDRSTTANSSSQRESTMESDENEDWKIIEPYYERIFKEKVTILPGMVSMDEFEIDLIVGVKSDKVRGIRLFEFFPTDEEDVDEPSKKSKDDQGGGDEEGENDIYDVIVYDLVATPGAKVPPGQAILEVHVAGPECCEEMEHVDVNEDEKKYWVSITLYEEENDDTADITGATLYYLDDPSKKQTVFVEDEDLTNLFNGQEE